MAYMLLILEQHGQRQTRNLEEGRALYDRMLAFGGDLRARGLLNGADALKGDSKGVRVAARNGKTTIVDGPFVESKEMIGGYFLVDCRTKEEAIALAKQCPAAEWATVEVREIGTCYEDTR